MTNVQVPMTKRVSQRRLDIGDWTLIGHWGLGIGHSVWKSEIVLHKEEDHGTEQRNHERRRASLFSAAGGAAGRGNARSGGAAARAGAGADAQPQSAAHHGVSATAEVAEIERRIAGVRFQPSRFSVPPCLRVEEPLTQPSHFSKKQPVKTAI